MRPSGTPILVQYRSFIPAVISWFDQRIAEDGYEDSRDAFWQHAAEAARYYDIFAMKWIEPTSNNCLKLRYEDLISDTLFWCGEAVKLFSPNGKIDSARLHRAVKTAESVKVGVDGARVRHGFGVRDTRNVTEFRYFTSSLERELQALLSPSAAKAQLTPSSLSLSPEAC